MGPFPVESSNVGYLKYDESSLALMVAFNDGYDDSTWEECRVYRYFDVPRSVFEALKDAESKGSYLCKNIAFEYRYELCE